MRGLLLETLGSSAIPATAGAPPSAPIAETVAGFGPMFPPPVVPPPFTAHSFSSPAAPTPPLLKPAPRIASKVPPSISALILVMVQELDANPRKLTALNPSRREQICQHLEQIALQQWTKTQLGDWIDSRHENQREALLTYLEEVAWVTFLQAALLKRWSEIGIHPLKADSLGKMNFELSMALKPFIPLQREGWTLTRPNLYSWYIPSDAIQREIARTLEGLALKDASASFLRDLAYEGRHRVPLWPECVGYDRRFMGEVFSRLQKLSVRIESPLAKRKASFYTPTLRLGELNALIPESAQWIGFESQAFFLLVAEISALWWGPSAPPLWSQGLGVEAHPREQMSFCPLPKATVPSALSEVESCEFAWIAEEHTQKATKFRQLLDGFPFFKKLRAAGTSLGMLQAIVAITKLRPGAKLFWIREAPLGSDEGADALAYLLGRGKLVAEVNLCGVQHALPSRAALYPKYLYVFERELNPEERMAHRPLRVQIQGQLKSHVELTLFVDDIVASIMGQPSPNRANWKVNASASPIPQKEWISRWPDATSFEEVERVERWIDASAPLSQIATVRPFSADHSVRTGLPSLGAGLRIGALESPRRLEVKRITDGASGLGVFVRDPAHLPILEAYLQSSIVEKWIEHSAERKHEKWIITESLLKLLPIHRDLVSILARDDLAGFLRATPPDESRESPWFRFARLALQWERAAQSRERLKEMLHDDGRIRWAPLMGIFSKNDVLMLSTHPWVRLEGALPPLAALTKTERLKSSSGFRLFTESGASLKATIENKLLSDIAWDQIQSLQHPTWHEIIGLVRLPRQLEVAESAAYDLLKSQEESAREMARIHAELDRTFSEVSV